jgi:hypothetical protein
LDGSHAFRLKEWPQIPERFRTARVLGACSRMTVGPVTANWLLTHTGLDAAQTSELIATLVAQGALERIELGPRAASEPTPRVAATADGKGLAARFPWKQAAVAAIFCLGVSAALDNRFHDSLGLIALPSLPSFSG